MLPVAGLSLVAMLLLSVVLLPLTVLSMAVFTLVVLALGFHSGLISATSSLSKLVSIISSGPDCRGGNSVIGTPFSSKVVVCGHGLMTLSLTITKH